jgi:hypothetical protein
LTEVIDQLVRPRRAARLEDVEEKLGSVDRDELLGAYRKHFDRWMAGSPEQVGERLRVEDDDRMAAALLGGLLKNKRKARDNPLDLPTVSRPGPSAWRDRLAGLLRAHYELDDLHLYAKQWTMGDGPWADLDDAAAGRDWLRGLGLNEVTYPDLYRARPAAIVDEINQEGRVTDVARAEFALSHDQLADLRDVCGRIEAIPAGDAAALIQSATSRRPKLSTKDAVALQEIAGLLTSACTRQGSPEDWQNWVSDLLVATSRRQSVAVQLMIGAWNILDRHAPDVPNEQLLQTCTRVIPVEKLPVEIREVIDQALRERHQVRQPVAASVPAISRHDSGVPPQDPMPPLPLRRTSEHSWSGRRPAGDWLRLHWKTALVLSGVAAFAVVLVFTIYAIFGLAPDDQPDGRASNDAGPPPTVPRPAAEALHLAPPVPATPPQQQADADYKKFTEWRDPARRPRIELLVLIIADRREDQDRANRLIDQLRGSYSIVEHKMIRHRSDSGQLSPLDVLVVTTVK